MRPSRRLAAGACIVLVAGAALACSGEGGTAPHATGPSVGVLAGGSYADTVDAPARVALTVEVRDSAGRVAQGTVVRFEATAPPDPLDPYVAAAFVCAAEAPVCGRGDRRFNNMLVAVDTTDRNGRADAVVRFGTVAGPTFVRVSVPMLGIRDSVPYTVLPGNPARIGMSIPDTSIGVGASYALRGVVTDFWANPRVEAVTFSASGDAATVDASGLVRGVWPGRGAVVAHFQAISASASVSVVPSGHVVAFRTGDAGAAPGLVELELDGSGFRTLVATSGTIFGAHPSWSPSGDRLLFDESVAGVPRLSVVDAQGGAVGPAIQDGTLAPSEEGQYSRDGRLIYFYAEDAAGGAGIWRAQADGSAAQPITALRNMSQPAVSPDGSRIAYNDGGTIKVLDVATGAVAVLGAGSFPRWAPNADLLAFVGSAYTDAPIVLVNADGTGRHALGTVNCSPGLDWSPDGQWIVASSGGNLVVLRTSNGEELPLRLDERPLREPAWKP